MKRTTFISVLVTAFMCFLLFSSCGGAVYLQGVKEKKPELKKLFSQLKKQTVNNESRFIIIQQIIRIMLQENETEALNLFLTSYTEENSADPFNGYYLMVVAQNYKQAGAFPFAVFYYDQIIKNYPDLLVQDSKIHLFCLKELINLTQQPEIRVDYYKELLARFQEEIDVGNTYYNLAKTYEALGEWDLSIQAYINFLKYPETYIPGVQDALKKVRDLVDFYTYEGPDWSYASLETLAANIKTAIYSQDVRLLKTYMRKINFFTISWEQQEEAQEETQEEDFITHLGTFLNQRVWCNSVLDRDSNAQEAYLQTNGWSYRINTWYLYFRRINFPADPERHGRWEWAGIYFGDKPFEGTGNAENT
ncbi:MAG: tetratricopeptide repeat protein [Spirochaetales bacterium]|nr:MAG: tetratricopeptide repeat protein [Spirochaetales bacterium]